MTVALHHKVADEPVLAGGEEGGQLDTLSTRLEQVPAPACVFCSKLAAPLAINSHLKKLTNLGGESVHGVQLSDLGINWIEDDWETILRPLITGRSDSIFRKSKLSLADGSTDTLIEIGRFPGSGETGFIVTFEPTQARRDTSQVLRDVENRYRATFENAAVGIAHFGIDGAWLSMNERLSDMLGYGEGAVKGGSFDDVPHTDDRIAYAAAVKNLLSGELRSASLETRTQHKDDGDLWVDVTMTLQRDIFGEPEYFIAIIQEITDRKTAESENAYFASELAHRCKNILTVVNSIASLLRSTSSTVDEYSEKLNARILGLARATDLIVSQNWKGAPIHQFCAACIEPFMDPDDPRLSFEGPDIFLSSGAAQALGMALYELTSNAMKHGSLSSSVGAVVFSWQESEDGSEFVFRWLERNGPVVMKPKKKGFGSVILKSATSASLRGTAAMDYDELGVVWTLSCPANALRGEP